MLKPNKNVFGGGKNTNLLGLKYEEDTNLIEFFINLGYLIRDVSVGREVYDGKKLKFLHLKKHEVYKFLKSHNIDWKKCGLSKKILPDELVIIGNNVIVFEKKSQVQGGSTDEKLATCDFKLKEYTKLFKPLKKKVKYVYILNDWFKRDEYKSVLKYIKSTGCDYYYNEIPLNILKLKDLKNGSK